MPDTLLFPLPLIFLPLLILLTTLTYISLARTSNFPSVQSVCFSPSHGFTKKPASSIRLLAGLGVQGDCHRGPTVQHRSRLHIRPRPANRRQVHLIASETLQQHGLKPGEIGENITTLGLDLLSLPRGARLRFVSSNATKPELSLGSWTSSVNRTPSCPTVVVQGLRNPCPQIDKFRPGLQEKLIVRDSSRQIIGRTAGVMGTVDAGGIVKRGMRIVVELPDEKLPLECV